MSRSFAILFVFATALFALSCNSDNGPDLPSVEERVSEATSNLRNDLTAPASGWRLEYQPTPESGIFFMLLKFTDKEVTIQSDVAANGGEFFEQTIPYRIDNASGLELILETFGVFHYLFELDASTFGAEFEFLFKLKDGNSLVFDSKSDFLSPTKLIFEPANAGDENLFSRDIAENLEAFVSASPQAIVQVTPSQQLILEDQNISVFWVLDPSKRSIQAEVAAVGTNIDQIIASGNTTNINQTTGYALLNGNLVLQQPISFVLGSQQVNINQIALTTLSMTGPSICSFGPNNTAKYTGQISGIGDVTLVSSLLSNRGSGFQPSVYSINVFFLFDGNGNSLTDPGGIIAENFPTAQGFVFFYGVQLNNPAIPIYSVGMILEDGELLLREYQPTTTQINLIKVNLTSTIYSTITPTAAQRQGLINVTNQLFEGGEVYAFDFPQNGVSRLFNPCNQNEIFLVQ